MMTCSTAGAMARLRINQGDHRGAVDVVVALNENLWDMAGDADSIDAATSEPASLAQCPVIDAALAAVAELHRQMVGLHPLSWTMSPIRYTEFRSLTDPELAIDWGHRDRGALTNPTLHEHGVWVPGDVKMRA